MATINNNVMNISGPILHKRGTEAALNASEYIPAAGEIIIATDTGRIKAGDGVNTWANLAAYDETTINNIFHHASFFLVFISCACSINHLYIEFSFF